jgi:hypothetical protein
MTNHPDHIQMIDAGLANRIRSRVGHIEVDLEAYVAGR